MDESASNPLQGDTFKHGFLEPIYVVVHGEADPSTTDWNAYVASMEKHARRVRGVFVYSRGGGPSPLQRRRVAEMWTRVGQNPPIAVLVPSAFLRGAITALNFFLARPIHTFSLDEVDAALTYLDTPGELRGKIRELTTASLRELAKPKSASA